MGAWIETKLDGFNASMYLVAPCVGAWIETISLSNNSRLSKSHPAWVRGLKLVKRIIDHDVENVAPCVGAWIETSKVMYIINQR